MAYETTNPPKCLIPRMGDSPAIWVYSDGDAHGTVEGSDYFTDGLELGMKVGDVVIVIDTDDGATTIHSVTVLDSDGNATINAATLA